MTFRSHALRTPRYILPDIETGYHLDPAAGFFSAILPLGVDKTNLVANPSVETNTTGFNANTGGALSRDTTVQKFGVASLKYIPSANANDGAWYSGVSLTAGTQYFASVWFKGQAGLKYLIQFVTTAFAQVGQINKFVATGFWQRVSCVYLAAATATHYVYVLKDSQSNLTPFWIDGLQVEQDQLTTYIDGDQRGFVRGRSDYYWNGTPHASTSVRLGQSRAGGKLVSFSDLGFRLLSVIGLGLGGIVNQMTPLSRGGAYYGGTVIADRQFTLVGQVDSSWGLQGLARVRQAFIDLIKPDVVTPDQPMVLRYQPSDDCGNALGPEQDIVCVSEGDPLAMRMDNLNSERLGLTFRLYLPFVAQEVGNAGGTLGYQGTFTAAYHAARIAGQWAALGTGFNGTVRVIAVDEYHNRIYFGGAFTTANGVTVNRVCYWNGTTFVAMDSGVNINSVFALAVAANGDLWVGGNFTAVGAGAAATKGLARWNFSSDTWTAFNESTATFADIQAIAISPTGTVYIGGDFTDWEGDAGSDRIAKTDNNGTDWDALGTGLDNSPFAIAIAPNGYIYVGGSFATGNGVTLNGIGYWNGTTFVAMGSYDMRSVTAIELDPSGNVYASGNFTTAGARIAVWNGSAWTALGTGLNGLGLSMAFASDGLLYVGGQFTSAGGLSVSDRVAIWNGSAWAPLDIDLPSTPNVYAIAALPNGNIILGYDTTGTATDATLTTITNTGSASTGPRITFTGPGTAVQLKNYTTGKAVYFNLTLNAGETAVLDLTDPSNITFISSFRGNILSTVLAGSQVADFTLAPGANIISLLIDGTTTAATAANIQWRITSHSIDAAIPGRLLP